MVWLYRYLSPSLNADTGVRAALDDPPGPLTELKSSHTLTEGVATTLETTPDKHSIASSMAPKAMSAEIRLATLSGRPRCWGADGRFVPRWRRTNTVGGSLTRIQLRAIANGVDDRPSRHAVVARRG